MLFELGLLSDLFLLFDTAIHRVDQIRFCDELALGLSERASVGVDSRHFLF